MIELDGEISGTDRYDDKYTVSWLDTGPYIYLELRDGDRIATHSYTPRQARKLAKRLKKAARAAGAV